MLNKNFFPQRLTHKIPDTPGGYEDDTYFGAAFPPRHIVSGHLVAVPEASEGKLFALSLALLIAVRLSAKAIHHLKFENSGHPSLF